MVKSINEVIFKSIFTVSLSLNSIFIELIGVLIVTSIDNPYF